MAAVYDNGIPQPVKVHEQRDDMLPSCGTKQEEMIWMDNIDSGSTDVNKISTIIPTDTQGE